MAADRPFLVRQLIEDAGFELELVAGAAGVDRECRGVSIGEHLDPTPWMARGSIHLTAGLALADQRGAAEGARLLRRLRDGGMVGLGVSIPHYLSEIPVAMRDEADRLGLPLFAVTGTTLFRDIEQYVYDVLASEEMQRLRRSLSAQQQLLEIMAGDAAPAGLVARLGALLEGNVLLTDPEGAALAAAGPAGALSPAAADELAARVWAAYLACDRAVLPRPVCRLGPQAVLWREVVVDGRLRMVLLVALDQARFQDEFAGATLDYVRRLLEVELRRRLAPSATSGASLLRELLGSPADVKRCVARLALGGIGEDGPFRLAVVRPRRPVGEAAAVTATDGDGADLARSCAAVLGLTGVRYILSPTVEGGVVALLSPERSNETVLHPGLAGELASALAAEGADCVVGMSEEFRDARLAPAACGHALQCVAGEDSLSSDGSGSGRCYEQLGVRRRLLGRLADAELNELSAHYLAPLRAADEAGGASRLVDSLACYLRRDGSISDAAGDLGVHRNTLCKRLARVEHLLAVDLDAVDDLVDVRLAFDAAEILASRRAAEHLA